MKKCLIILSALIILSGLGIFLNYANYENNAGKLEIYENYINSIDNELELIDTKIVKLEKENNTLKEKYKEKIEELEKWEKKNEEIENTQS